LPNIDGPLASLRMKAYRRGLQDYEYAWLLKQNGKEKTADDLVRKVVPSALTDATGTTMGAREGEQSAQGEQRGGAASARRGSSGPAWSRDVADWYAFREAMAAELEH
jgi:hypothetical protein